MTSTPRKIPIYSQTIEPLQGKSKFCSKLSEPLIFFMGVHVLDFHCNFAAVEILQQWESRYTLPKLPKIRLQYFKRIHMFQESW